MPATLPALNLIAEPGRRRATLDTAREIERRGFAGISVSSSFGNMSQSVGLALATEHIPFATAIAPIYAQSTDEFAQNAAYLHEVSGGRFQYRPTSAWRSSRASHLATFVPLSRS